VKYKIPFIKPDFPDAEDVAADYARILEANWFTNFGPFEREFAKEVAAYVGPGYFASTFSSATSGLLASILAVLGRGDGSRYVIMPSFTFAAGAEALIWCGYKPLFIDIENGGLHMDLTAAQTALNDPEFDNKIAGILFCNAFGVGTVNIEAWESLAEEAGLPLIIDSAAGFGSLYSETRKVGSAGRCEIFSFHATKPFAIGEGGAVVSRDEALIKSLNSIQNFGFVDKSNTEQLGFNGKLQEFNAAIGLRQFKRFDSILQNRRAVLEKYRSGLNPEAFRFQQNAENASLCFAAALVQDAQKRDGYLASLQAAGVEAKTYYSPSLHKQTYFKTAEKHAALTATELVDDSVLSLPIHDNMREEDIDLIINVLNG